MLVALRSWWLRMTIASTLRERDAARSAQQEKRGEWDQCIAFHTTLCASEPVRPHVMRLRRALFHRVNTSIVSYTGAQLLARADPWRALSSVTTCIS